MERILDERAGFWYRQIASDGSLRGLPDFAVCGPGGIFMGLELKLGKDVVSPIQAYRLSQICKAGGVGAVVRTEEDLLAAFEAAEALQRGADRGSNVVRTRGWSGP